MKEKQLKLIEMYLESIKFSFRFGQNSVELKVLR